MLRQIARQGAALTRSRALQGLSDDAARFLGVSPLVLGTAQSKASGPNKSYSLHTSSSLLSLCSNGETFQGVACRSRFVESAFTQSQLVQAEDVICRKLHSSAAPKRASVPATRAERKLEQRRGTPAAARASTVQPGESSDPPVPSNTEARDLTEPTASRASDVQVRKMSQSC